jgi:multicomponent Na+:H+ antiporter subunit D
MIPVFSLAGVPPLSGFLGKLAIVEGTFAAGAYWVGAVVLGVGLLTLLSMARLWADAFWRPAGRGQDALPPSGPLLATIAGLSVLTLGFTFAAEPIFALTSRAASQLLDPHGYITAVLGAGR